MTYPTFTPGFRLIDGSDLNALVSLITLGAPVSFGGPNRSAQAAVTGSVAGMVVSLAPGNYAETLVIPRSKGPITIVGAGPRGSAYGGLTQPMLQNSRFHNLSAASFEEGFSAGGAATLQWRNLTIRNNIVDGDEAGVQPTKYLSLNDSDVNTGVASGNQFPVAI